MRYALRNQDKIAAAYSSEYLKEHIIGSLDSYFNVPRSQEEVEDFIYSSCVCYSTNQGNYPIMQINDIADDNAMDAKTFFTKVVLMRKAQKDYFKCRTQQNLRKCKALETEIDGEIERVNSITGVSSVSKEPRQTNLFTD